MPSHFFDRWMWATPNTNPKQGTLSVSYTKYQPKTRYPECELHQIPTQHKVPWVWATPNTNPKQGTLSVSYTKYQPNTRYPECELHQKPTAFQPPIVHSQCTRSDSSFSHSSSLVELQWLNRNKVTNIERPRIINWWSWPLSGTYTTETFIWRGWRKLGGYPANWLQFKLAPLKYK